MEFLVAHFPFLTGADPVLFDLFMFLHMIFLDKGKAIKKSLETHCPDQHFSHCFQYFCFKNSSMTKEAWEKNYLKEIQCIFTGELLRAFNVLDYITNLQEE